MEQDLHHADFWLPSDFLTDEDDDNLLPDFKITEKSFNYETEEEEEEEEEEEGDHFINGLTQNISNYNFSSDYTTNGWKLSGSPQSTLCGYKPGSSRGSPNGISRVSSPTQEAKEAVGLDLLSAAAGEIAMIRLIEEKTANYSTKLSLSSPNPNRNRVTAGFYSSQTQTPLSYNQLKAEQFEQMKQHETMKRGVWGQRKSITTGYQLKNGMTSTDSSMAVYWPTLEQSQQAQLQSGRGMRAVFLGETGVKKERIGTGVFIPRRFGPDPPSESSKKPGCSVLLPDRVVHPLKNLNLDPINSQTQPRINPNFTPDYDAIMKYRNNLMMVQQRRYLIQQQQEQQQHQVMMMKMNQEVQLPHEWTY